MKYRIVITLLFVLALAAAFKIRNSGSPTSTTTPTTDSTPAPTSSPKQDEGIKLN